MSAQDQPTALEALLGPRNDIERKNAPAHVFYAANRRILEAGPRVSVVGSRKASPRGLNNARGLAAWLVRGGVVVIGGLAEGIDTAAHRGAIDAGGKTVGVLGTPLEKSIQRRIRRYNIAS